eukprot:PhF_6_TR15414/c0_g1_i2/m.23895/K16795/PAFAH1B2_3; platelet-activating factor acetylhydrolase IB subunit beta/gamma
MSSSDLPYSAWKERSANTYQQHLATAKHIVTTTTSTPTPPPYCLLIGDSLLERMYGRGVTFPEDKKPFYFNCGVGGDKIENLLWRLSQPPLWEILQNFQSIRTVVVWIGTNNLKANMKPEAIPAFFCPRYDAVFQAIETMFRTSSMPLRVVVFGLTYRTDIPNTVV